MATVISDYLTLALDTPKRHNIVKNCVDFLSPCMQQFDCIAFRGMSGALIAPEVATHLSKGLLLIRKDGDSSHSSRVVEGVVSHTRYIILDDFVRSGATVRAIYRALCRRHALESLDDQPIRFAQDPRPLFVLQYGRRHQIESEESVALYDENDALWSLARLRQQKVPLYGCSPA